MEFREGIHPKYSTEKVVCANAFLYSNSHGHHLIMLSSSISVSSTSFAVLNRIRFVTCQLRVEIVPLLGK